MRALLDRLDRLARPAVIVGLLAFLVSFSAALFPAATGRIAESSGGLETLDVTPGFSATEAVERIDALGPRARATYLWMELTLDAVFPLLHGLVVALLLLWLLRHAAPSRPGLRWLAVLPLAGAVADWLENAAIVVLLLAHPAAPLPAAAAAAVAGRAKWLLVGGSLALVPLLALLALFRAARVRLRLRDGRSAKPD